MYPSAPSALMGLCLIDERTTIIGGSRRNLRLTMVKLRSSEKDFETLQLGAFATPGQTVVYRLCYESENIFRKQGTSNEDSDIKTT
jgi:hypothetical protein